jgi:hypothetical protein
MGHEAVAAAATSLRGDFPSYVAGVRPGFEKGPVLPLNCRQRTP